MHALVKEMIHYRNSLPEGCDPDPAWLADVRSRYAEILEKGLEEYKDTAPGSYHREGYNLALRMQKYREYHLLFLDDIRVPATKNEAERLLRKYKRKQAQAVSMRSQDSVGYVCDGMSILQMLRHSGEENIFNRVAEIFG